MARVLGIDTTSEFGGLALVENGELRDELLPHSPDGFGHLLFDALRELLARAGWTLASVDCYAGASGPGSFTGVRVGLTAAKGLADAEGKPVVAISNLAAVAAYGQGPVRAALLDARRGEIYGGLYDAAGRALADEAVMALPAWLETSPPDVEFVTPAVGLFTPLLGGAEVREAPRSLAAMVARMAHARYEAGLAVDPVGVDANYVRRSDAELFWKD